MSTTETLRYALAELDDTTRKEGRATSFGDVHVGLSDPQGNLQAGSASLEISDLPNRPIATHLGTAGQKYFYGDQIEIFCRSQAGRIANTTPTLLARVLLDDDSYEDGAVARFSGTDPFFANNTSLFGTDQTFPYVLYPRAYEFAPEDIFTRMMPVILGEVTDAGAIDPATGLPNPRGKCPLTFVGMDGLPTGPGGSGEEWGRFNVCLWAIYKITGLFGSDLGGGLYGIGTATSDGGTPSTIALDGLPDLSSVATDGTIPITLFTTTGILKSQITAIVGSSVTIDNTIATLDATDVDWVIGERPSARTEIDLATRNGVDVMVPKWPGYVRAFDYEDLLFAGETTRVTDVWVRGPLLQAHLNGEVTLTVNAIGIEDQGDGSGLPITDYFTAEYWWWVNCAVAQTRMPGGIGFLGKWPQTDGDIAAVHGAWADGIYKVNGNSFADAQAWSTTITTGGYKVSAYLDTPQAMRDVAQAWNDNAGGPIVRTGINEAGQIFKWFLETNADTSTQPRIARAERIFGRTRRWNAKTEIENVTQGTCDWDPDGEAWRRGTTTITNDLAIQHTKGIRFLSKHLDGRYVANLTQWTDMLTARNGFTKDGPVYVRLEGGDPGCWDLPLGSGFRYTDEILSLIDEPLVIIAKTFRLQTLQVELLCLDLGAGPIVNGIRTAPAFIGAARVVPVGSLALTGQAPQVISQTQVAAGSISLTGLAPTLALRLAIPVGTVGVTGQTPTRVVA
jgi:hypothetical protein